jgi:hypothetical protein
MGCADQAQELAAPWFQAVLEAAKKRLHHNVLAIKLARIASRSGQNPLPAKVCGPRSSFQLQSRM